MLEHPGADDDASSTSGARPRPPDRRRGKAGQLVGSDFTYEDIGGRELTDHAYAIVDPAASWTDPQGGRGRHGGSVRAKYPTATYPRWSPPCSKDTFVVVAADNFNRRDEVSKAFEVRKLERVSGIWTPSSW